MSFSSTISSTSLSPYASSVSSMSTTETSLSSVYSCDSPRGSHYRPSLNPKDRHQIDDAHWSSSIVQIQELRQKLVSAKQESETMQHAWSVRCRTLEQEVSRLARLQAQMEDERRELVRQLALTRAFPTLVPNFNPFEDDTSPSSVVGVRCAWNGVEWKPINQELPFPSRPKTPRIDPTKSMSKQDPPPCNSHYLNGSCSVPRCKFSHLYKLTPTQVEEMRRGAKFHLCNSLKNGVQCEDPLCCYGHTCPRGSACGRSNCAFNDEQHHLPSGSSLLALRPAPRRHDS